MSDQMSITTLAGIITHDLKNQLQSLTSLLEGFSDSINDEQRPEFVQIEKNTFKITLEILRLTHLYKLQQHQSDHIPLSMNEHWLRDTATEVIENAHIQYPDIEFENLVDMDIAGFYSDQLIQLALLSAVNNSAQAGATKISLNCQTDKSSQTSDFTFTITDNGEGIDQAVLEHQVSTTKEFGTGLGLAFIDLICESHCNNSKCGRMDLLNNPEGGATVSLYIP